MNGPRPPRYCAACWRLAQQEDEPTWVEPPSRTHTDRQVHAYSRDGYGLARCGANYRRRPQ